MKKLLFLAVSLLVLASCGDGGAPKATASQAVDSLQRVIDQKDSEIDDLMGTFNDIEEGFREISEAEGRVTLAKRGEGASSAARIRENMQFIQTTMAQNRDLINKLRQQVREGSVRGTQLQRAIDNLTAQLEAKDAELQQLREELAAKDIHIAELDEQVASLNENVNELQEESTRQEQTIDNQDREIHSAWYVFGTKRELKDKNILNRGEVLRTDFSKDYFTKIDIRVTKEIKFLSSKAEILTNHPAGSYSLIKDANKQYVLYITNPTQFWSTSKYLVVQVK